jgi:hypothetical protein
MKKWLLVFTAVSCTVVYSVEYNEDKEKLSPELQQLNDYETQKNLLHKAHRLAEELAEYQDVKKGLFREALFKSLFENSNAVEELAQKNMQEYTQEEEQGKNLQDDTIIGSWGGYPPTVKSINGRVCTYIVNRKVGKVQINNDLKKTFSEYKEIFNTKILPTLYAELIHKEYEMEETFSRGLDRCGMSKDGLEVCLLKQNIYLSAIKKDGFFDDFIFAAFEQVINEVKKEGIPLTEDEIIKISRTKVLNQEGRVYSMNTLDDSKKKVLIKLRDLLYPKEDGTDSSSIHEDSSNVDGNEEE